MEDLHAGDPRQLGPYRLIARLGSGGMGRVFLGRSPGGRLVAVKAIRPELAEDADFRARFAREVASARSVGGMFTAEVIDADPDRAVPWLATAYVAGPSLADTVEGHGPLPAGSVLALAAGLAEALAAIHAAGVVHRDLKPSNVLLAADGPRVIDFGISRAAEASALTRTGLVVGTPGFMSPEQAEGGEVGMPSDVFSLGGVLTFAATGDGPFGTGTTAALIYRIVHGQPDIDQVPSQIRPLVARCLAKDPAMRPAMRQIVTEVGTAQLAEDWLPGPIAAVLGRYAVPAAASGPAGGGNSPAQDPDRASPLSASPQAGDLAGPSTVTTAKRRGTRDPVTAGRQPSAAAQALGRRRRYLAWGLVAAGLLAASGAGIVALAKTPSGTTVARLLHHRRSTAHIPGPAPSYSSRRSSSPARRSSSPARRSSSPARRSSSPARRSSSPAPQASPAAPTNLAATPVNSSSIRLTWADNSDNETGFEINNGVTSQKAAANTTSYTWGGLAPNTYMCFKIRAYDSAGSSSWDPDTSPWYVCTTTPK